MSLPEFTSWPKLLVTLTVPLLGSVMVKVWVVTKFAVNMTSSVPMVKVVEGLLVFATDEPVPSTVQWLKA